MMQSYHRTGRPENFETSKAKALAVHVGLNGSQMPADICFVRCPCRRDHDLYFALWCYRKDFFFPLCAPIHSSLDLH